MDASEAAGPSQATPRLLTALPLSDAVLIRSEQIGAAYKPMPRMWGAPLSGLLLVVAMSSEVAAGTLAAWLVTLCAAIGYMLFLYFKYMREAPSPDQADRWGMWLVIAVFIYGCAWGSAGIVMFRPNFTIYQTFLILGLFMVAISTMAGGLTAFMPTVYAFLLPATAPLLIRTAVEGDFLHLMVTAAGIILLALIHYYAAHLNRQIVESFRLRFENMLARKRAEEANHAKSRFLAAASHDLRQPLHTLSLYSAALKLHAPEGAMGEIASHINTALASLSVLVNSLLDISKLDAGAVEPELQSVCVRTLIERIEADYQPVAFEKGLEFRVAAVNALVKTDPVLLERVLRNLIDNAFKYTVAGTITLAAEMDDRTVRIAVRDTGPGIPAAERERIFEEFYQIGNPERERSQGLGLGLAIVQRLVRLLGMDLQLESEPGSGSAFSVAMPRAIEIRPAPRETTAAVYAENSRVLDGARVLVIDDEPEVRAGMQTLLEYLGCRVAVCGGLAEAQCLLDEHALEPDMIVADFRLRQHENGIDTVRRLRARLGNVPALLVTGDTAPERLREAHSSGLPLLHKPVSADKLMESMLEVLRR
jgi:signal transduction histidine kinase